MKNTLEVKIAFYCSRLLQKVKKALFQRLFIFENAVKNNFITIFNAERKNRININFINYYFEEIS